MKGSTFDSGALRSARESKRTFSDAERMEITWDRRRRYPAINIESITLSKE